MDENVKIDERFRRAFYGVAKAAMMAEIPLLVMRASDHAAFIDQAAAVLGGTVVYTSQCDFVKQMLASMTNFDYLFALIDEPLEPTPYKLILAYLAARDIMGADLSALANQFNAAAPHPQHRLILIVNCEVFDRHDSHALNKLARLCTVVRAWARSDIAEKASVTGRDCSSDPCATNLGILLAEQGCAVEAEAAYREAIRINPQNANAHFNLGILLAEQGCAVEAEAAYREAIRINPQDALAHNNLGFLLAEQGRAVEAEAAYREAIRIDPRNALTHINLGNLLAEQGRAVQAEAAYREAIRINPQDADLHNNLGILLKKQGRAVQAEAAYREAIRINPQDALALNNLGALLAEQARPLEAEAAFREAIRINPRYALAHNNLAILLKKQGRPVEAQ
jgi:Flp pilus assembly protein TadD